MSNPIVSFDEQAVKRPIARAGQENHRGDHQRDARRGGRPARRRRALRAHRRARRLPRRPLRARFHRDVGPGHAQDAQTQGDEVRRRRHRALQKARDLGRGGHHRDAPGRRVDAAHRGRQRDPLGRRRFRRHGLQPERQGVRGRGRMEMPSPGPRMPVRLHRRHLPEAQLGSAPDRERGGHGGDRRERGRIPRGRRLRRGLHGNPGGAGAASLSWLESRGLRGVRMSTGDKAAGMVGSKIAEVFPGAKYQRCTVHFYRNALAKVPKSKRSQVAAMLKAIHAMESRDASGGQGRIGGRRAASR